MTPLSDRGTGLEAALAPFVALLARVLAPAIAAELARTSRPEMIDQRSTAELARLDLSPRSYLTAARAGAFPSTKHGRRVVARLADVEAWRAGDSAPKGSAVVAPISAEDQERRELGLAPKRGRR